MTNNATTTNAMTNNAMTNNAATEPAVDTRGIQRLDADPAEVPAATPHA